MHINFKCIQMEFGNASVCELLMLSTVGYFLWKFKEWFQVIKSKVIPRISRQRWEIGKGVNIMNDHCSYINGLNPPPAIIFSIFNYLNYFILGFEKYHFFWRKKYYLQKIKLSNLKLHSYFCHVYFYCFRLYVFLCVCHVASN